MSGNNNGQLTTSIEGMESRVLELELKLAGGGLAFPPSSVVVVAAAGAGSATTKTKTKTTIADVSSRLDALMRSASSAPAAAAAAAGGGRGGEGIGGTIDNTKRAALHEDFRAIDRLVSELDIISSFSGPTTTSAAAGGGGDDDDDDDDDDASGVPSDGGTRECKLDEEGRGDGRAHTRPRRHRHQGHGGRHRRIVVVVIIVVIGGRELPRGFVGTVRSPLRSRRHREVGQTMLPGREHVPAGIGCLAAGGRHAGLVRWDRDGAFGEDGAGGGADSRRKDWERLIFSSF